MCVSVGVCLAVLFPSLPPSFLSFRHSRELFSFCVVYNVELGKRDEPTDRPTGQARSHGAKEAATSLNSEWPTDEFTDQFMIMYIVFFIEMAKPASVPDFV